MNLRGACSTIGWGIYLACSWTWCIALYLPVLLIDRFGWPGFIAFAVPNVVGCAAFGYVVRSRVRSETMVGHHRGPMIAFSLVTVGFHVFFLAFLLVDLLPHVGWPVFVALVAPILMFVIGFAVAVQGNRMWLAFAVATYLLSLTALFVVGLGATEIVGWTGTNWPTDLAWLAPVFFFGFLLCPYLDLTFHRALRESPSRHAFGVFGIAFGVMIFFTCLLWWAPRDTLPAIAIAHLLVQITFTVAAHLRELRAWVSKTRPLFKPVVLLLPLAAIALLPAAHAIWGDSAMVGERLYIRFFIFYALIFPAYAIVFMHPGWAPRKTKRNLAILAAAVVAAMPVYEIGFIHEHWWVLAIPTIAVFSWIVFASVKSRACKTAHELASVGAGSERAD